MPRLKHKTERDRAITLHYSQTLPRDLVAAFFARNQANGHGTHAAIARLMRRYVERGFDDGQPEQHQPQTPAPSASRGE